MLTVRGHGVVDVALRGDVNYMLGEDVDG